MWIPRARYTDTPGTTACLPPERLKDIPAVLDKMDVWAIGMMAHFYLTASVPFYMCADSNAVIKMQERMSEWPLLSSNSTLSPFARVSMTTLQ